jgi:POT family proton-dependent oligopeptide transporter
MLIGLFVYITRAKPTLGELGMNPSKHPDPKVQAKRENQIKLSAGIGLGILALLFVLGATGILTIDAQQIGQYMAYVLVGIAVFYFAYLFLAGGLDGGEKKRVVVIALLFVAAAIFWAGFEQAPTSLNLFARDFTERNIAGYEVPATWFQSINSLFIIILAPVFAALWVWLGKRKMDFSSPVKFALGLIIAGLGFVIMVYPANWIVASNGALKVSWIWLTLTYLFHTIGELCLSPVGLSSMTKLSPRRYVGQMMGIWFLASSLGNLIAGLVGGHVDPEKLDQTPKLFMFTAAFMIGSGIVVWLLSFPIRKMMNTTSTEAGESVAH